MRKMEKQNGLQKLMLNKKIKATFLGSLFYYFFVIPGLGFM